MSTQLYIALAFVVGNYGALLGLYRIMLTNIDKAFDNKIEAINIIIK